MVPDVKRMKARSFGDTENEASMWFDSSSLGGRDLKRASSRIITLSVMPLKRSEKEGEAIVNLEPVLAKICSCLDLGCAGSRGMQTPPRHEN